MNGHVLVTGASRGIGLACARRLARAGFHVFAAMRSPDVFAHEHGDLIGKGITPVTLDVTDSDSIAAAFHTIELHVGTAGLHGVVNNAGIAVAGPLEVLPLDAFRRQMEVNVTGLLAVVQAAVPLLRKARGRIVNIGSISGRSALPITGAYSASKFAVEAISDALRVELRPWHIHVSVVEPGMIATDIWETSQNAADALMREIPPASLSLYDGAIAAARRRVANAGVKGASPDSVARAVEHALTARVPRVRYLVGRDARVRMLLERLPVRWKDRLIARALRQE